MGKKILFEIPQIHIREKLILRTKDEQQQQMKENTKAIVLMHICTHSSVLS